MISVKAKYINIPSKKDVDYFVFLDVEVSGHATHNNYTDNIKVCAGVSACCCGIYRLMNEEQYKVECRKGYFHCYTNITQQIKSRLDKDSVYALNTLICQLYEIYCMYPLAFNSFDLVEIKEKIDDEQRKNKPTKPFRRRKNKLDIYSIVESPHFKEN